MLIVSSDSTTDSSAPRSLFSGNRVLLIALIALMLYSWLSGLGFLLGWWGINNAYLLMALPCLVLVGWCIYGFIKAGERQDFSLLISALGWGLIFLALLVRHNAVQTAHRFTARTGLPVVPAPTPLATILIWLAVAALIVGAYLAWDSWNKEQTQHDLLP